MRTGLYQRKNQSEQVMQKWSNFLNIVGEVVRDSSGREDRGYIVGRCT